MLRLKSRARPITVLGVLVLCAGTSYTAEIRWANLQYTHDY